MPTVLRAHVAWRGSATGARAAWRHCGRPLLTVGEDPRAQRGEHERGLTNQAHAPAPAAAVGSMVRHGLAHVVTAPGRTRADGDHQGGQGHVLRRGLELAELAGPGGGLGGGHTMCGWHVTVYLLSGVPAWFLVPPRRMWRFTSVCSQCHQRGPLGSVRRLPSGLVLSVQPALLQDRSDRDAPA